MQSELSDNLIKHSFITNFKQKELTQIVKFLSLDEWISYHTKNILPYEKRTKNFTLLMVKFDTVRKSYEFLSKNEYRTKTYEDGLEKQPPLISKKHLPNHRYILGKLIYLCVT